MSLCRALPLSVADWFLQYTDGAGHKNGTIFNQPRLEGDQFFIDYRNPAAAAYFVRAVVTMLVDNDIDLVFTDDREGIPVEHESLPDILHLLPAEVADIQFATQAFGQYLATALAANGKTCWDCLAGLDLGPRPIAGETCAPTMRELCDPGAQGRSMFMGFSGESRAGANTLNQTVAAFLVTRPPIAFLGSRWQDEQWEPIFALDVGEPLGLCAETAPGVFERAWSKGTVSLDCNTWEASLPFTPLVHAREGVEQLALQSPTSMQQSTAPTPLPCDVFASAGTPCAAAHALTRALFTAYDGPLYQVRRLSDNATLDIGPVSPGGVADAAAQNAFCSRDACVVQRIYDQTQRNNTLDIAPPGGHVHTGDQPLNATALPVTIGGVPVWGALFGPGVGYRIENTSGIAKGNDAETIFMVTSGAPGLFNSRCCFDCEGGVVVGGCGCDNNTLRLNHSSPPFSKTETLRAMLRTTVLGQWVRCYDIWGLASGVDDLPPPPLPRLLRRGPLFWQFNVCALEPWHWQGAVGVRSGCPWREDGVCARRHPLAAREGGGGG